MSQDVRRGGWSDEGFRAVAQYCAARTGLSFLLERPVDSEAGIQRDMARAGVAGVHQYLALLRTDSFVLDGLVDEVTVGETYFFREPLHFEFLREEVLPGILRDHGPGRPFRAWSAACATGEEPYSLAMLFDEAGVADRVQILATDVSRAVLAKATRGEYRGWSFRAPDEGRLRRFFRPVGERLVIQPRLRARVAFARLNLAEDEYPSLATDTWGMDLILCRNVLIYFDAATIRSVARRLFECLVPGGWLLTASTDPMLTEHAPFQAVVTPAGVLLQRPPPGQVVAPKRARRVPGPRPAVPQPAARPAPHLHAARKPEPQPRLTSPDPSAELEAARTAVLRGDYSNALGLCARLPPSAPAESVRVRALAGACRAGEALAAAEAAVRRFPTDCEVRFLHAMLLLHSGDSLAARRELRRVLYLDRRTVMAHLALGALQARLGEAAAARRSLGNARALCAELPAGQVVPLSDGESAARVLEAIDAQAAVLQAMSEEVA
jgi:chemotaxis protein methyltransferase CheR